MVKLYIESMKLKLKSQLEDRLSFILTFISQIGVFFTYYFMTVALFQRFDNIKGFTLYEVLLTFAIIQLGFSFCESFFKGIDHFDNLIIDAISMQYFSGATIDYTSDRLKGSQFVISNPNAKSTCGCGSSFSV